MTAAPVAVVLGTPYSDLPEDLYIPPDALEVFLESFEGPLDLLLYLIRHQNIDILDIPVASITRQYIVYIDVMTQMRMELAAEYLVMAAFLTELKSRILLPKPVESEEEAEDPRAELVRRLQVYEQFKQAADELDALPRCERDTFTTGVDISLLAIEQKLPEVHLDQLLLAFQEVLQRAEKLSHHRIQREPLSIRERMTRILEHLQTHTQGCLMTDLLHEQEGRSGVVVTLLALLELCREGLIALMQEQPYGPVTLRVA